MLDRFLWAVIPLIFAHLLADFSLQSDDSVQRKEKITGLIRHGLVVGVLSYLFLGLVAGWLIPVGIAVSHTLLDAWKLRSSRWTRLTRFLVDQGGHLMILGLFSWAAAYSPGGLTGIWSVVFGRGYLVALAFLSGAILAVYVGSFIVELAFEALGYEIQGLSGEERPGERGDLPETGLPEGGRVIGYLERSLILIFILAGYPAGIGFLIAAKSVFRFGELTDSSRRSQAEYIIIGTLLSILFGTVVSYLTAEAIQLILS